MNTTQTPDNQTEWRIDFAALPGPERSKLAYAHDVVQPAATKDLAAVVYSAIELRMGSYGGYFALFEGPPEAPRVLWCPHLLPCDGGLNSLQWLDGDRYVVANGYMYDGKKYLAYPFLFVDVEQQQVAYFQMMNSYIAVIESTAAGWIIREREKDTRFPSRDGERIDPQALYWLPWSQIDELKAHYWEEVKGPEKPGWFRRLLDTIFGNRD
ncbi:hypothetical protein [Gimesia panareensis]|nr:hypothetical protein [Gimesia panareensis]